MYTGSSLKYVGASSLKRDWLAGPPGVRRVERARSQDYQKTVTHRRLQSPHQHQASAAGCW